MSDAQMQRDHARQLTVERAVTEADQILMDGSDGTAETTDRLTEKVAIALLSAATVGGFPLPPGDDNQLILSVVDKALLVVSEHEEKDPAVQSALRVKVAIRFTNKIFGRSCAKLMSWDLKNSAKAE